MWLWAAHFPSRSLCFRLHVIRKKNRFSTKLDPKPETTAQDEATQPSLHIPLFSPSSTTASPPPLPFQTTQSSGTAKPPVQLSDLLQQQEEPGRASNSAPSSQPALGLLPTVAASIAAPFLLHTLGPS